MEKWIIWHAFYHAALTAPLFCGTTCRGRRLICTRAALSSVFGAGHRVNYAWAHVVMVSLNAAIDREAVMHLVSLRLLCVHSLLKGPFANELKAPQCFPKVPQFNPSPFLWAVQNGAGRRRLFWACTVWAGPPGDAQLPHTTMMTPPDTHRIWLEECQRPAETTLLRVFPPLTPVSWRSQV